MIGEPRREVTDIPGVRRLKLNAYADPRGVFSPAWVRADLLAAGLDAEVAQINLVTNPAAGTLRGLHFQAAPHSEVKILQVLSGAIFDVVVDLRQESPSFQAAIGVFLDAENREALYLPKGVAHGYQTLLPDTTVLYMVSSPYAPAHQGGVRWDDSALAIPWPLQPTLMSERDMGLPLLFQIDSYPGDV